MDKILPKFKGIKAYEELMKKESTEECNLEAQGHKRKSIEIDPKLKAKSNEKRLKSLKEKIDFDKSQQIVVKEAIISGKRINKRIVFDNDIDDSFGGKINSLLSEEKNKSNDKSMKKSKPRKATNLFGSDSEDDGDIDGNKDNNRLKDFDIDFDKKINNKNAEKLIELNSRFAHDSRFRIDERFWDQTQDNEEVDEVISEKEKNIHILEEVLGKSLKSINKSSDKKDKKSQKNPKTELFITRFDPKNEKSSELEVKSTSPEKKSNKKVSFDQKILEKEVKDSAVSKEVYYEVSDSLKHSLSQKEEEFSLTQMFGTSSAEDPTEKTLSNTESVKPFYDKLDNNKRKIDNSRNPFKYDSSSSDEEEADEEVVKTKSDSRLKDKRKPNSNGYRFFFDKKDPRFDEDVFWDKELVQKVRTNWKERQIMIMRGMTVRKKSAKKNQKAKQKTFLKYKNQKNPNFKRFPKKDNQNDD